MPEILDILETRKLKTDTSFAERIGGAGEDRAVLNGTIDWLADELKTIYREAIEHSKSDIAVREVFELWKKMVGICDYFLDQLTAAHARFPDCPVDPSRIVDLRIKCEDKMEFHRC